MRVLITYGWCRTAYAVAESLARSGMDVHACGSSALCMTRASRYVRGFDRVPDPFGEPDAYVDALAESARRHRIDLLLPVHEDSLIIQRRRDRLPWDLIVACPPADKLELAVDKLEVVRLASAAGVHCPRTLAPANLEEALEVVGEMPLPFVMKTRRGNGGKGVFVARSREEAGSRYVEMVKRFGLDEGRLPIVQEFVDGQVRGGCFLSRDGFVHACFTERYLRCKEGGFGTSVLREPFEHPQLRDHTCRLARALDWTGIGHFDFVWDRSSDRMVFIEMNPRFWGAVNMAIRNGYDFPTALVHLYTTGRPKPGAFRPVHPPVMGLWIAGELIAGTVELLHGKLSAPIRSLWRIMRPGGPCSYDDFRLTDPLPMIVELAYYAAQFALSGGDPNPCRAEMMR